MRTFYCFERSFPASKPGRKEFFKNCVHRRECKKGGGPSPPLWGRFIFLSSVKVGTLRRSSETHVKQLIANENIFSPAPAANPAKFGKRFILPEAEGGSEKDLLHRVLVFFSLLMVFLFLFVRHNNDGSCQSGCVALDFKHMTTVQLKVNETLRDLG